MINVLFLCVENSCRSQIAEAICNNLFSTKIKGFSAGSNPADKINSKAQNYLYFSGILDDVYLFLEESFGPLN